MISRSSLRRWLARTIGRGAACVQIVHVGSEDQRVCQTYDLPDLGAGHVLPDEDLNELVANVLTDCQDECNLLDQRASFTVAVMRATTDGPSMVGSQRVRCEVEADGRSDPDGERDIDTSKEGTIGILSANLKFAYRELGAAPARQRQVYEGLLDVLNKIIADLRKENETLYKLLMKSAEKNEIETVIREEQERQNELIGKVLSDVKEIAIVAAPHLFAKVTGINPPANGAAL